MGGGGKKGGTPKIIAPPAVEEKAPDTQVTGKKKRDKQRGTSSTIGLNRFLITPASGGSGASVPE